MADFLARFGENGQFSAARQGTIVGLLCIGTLVGCLASGWICDRLGRKWTISSAAFFYIIGVVIEVSSEKQWVQFAMGRFTAGMGIGALSTSVPMYQSESVPKNIRGATVASYQLMITLGIWTAYMVSYYIITSLIQLGANNLQINWHTEAAFDNSAQWRIPNALSMLWALILGGSILFMPESPRFAYRMGRVEEARNTLAKLNGVDPYSKLIDDEVKEIDDKLKADNAQGVAPWYEIFTGPSMLYRTLLGMVLQAGQQLTGANFFFYYGTTIFKSTGIENSYITSIILGSVNVGATVGGLWIVKNCGRRKALMAGAAWMFMCFMVYAFVGSFVLDANNPMATPTAGKVLIVFTCLFIVAFATTWGPLVWAVVGEMYPSRYRAPAMAVATASNWLFNFLISFFTTFITNAIHYFYGLVFGGCCLALFFIVYFFMMETKDRSLEEIDTMYTSGVNPRKSAGWKPSVLPADVKVAENKETVPARLMAHDERVFPENPDSKPAMSQNPTQAV